MHSYIFSVSYPVFSGTITSHNKSWVMDVNGLYSKCGTALHCTESWLPRNMCRDCLWCFNLFNIIIPEILHSEFTLSAESTPIYQWIAIFLTYQAPGEVGEHHIQHLHSQHWCPAGVCGLPTPLLPIHECICNYTSKIKKMASIKAELKCTFW